MVTVPLGGDSAVRILWSRLYRVPSTVPVQRDTTTTESFKDTLDGEVQKGHEGNPQGSTPIEQAQFEREATQHLQDRAPDYEPDQDYFGRYSVIKMYDRWGKEHVLLIDENVPFYMG